MELSELIQQIDALKGEIDAMRPIDSDMHIGAPRRGAMFVEDVITQAISAP